MNSLSTALSLQHLHIQDSHRESNIYNICIYILCFPLESESNTDTHGPRGRSQLLITKSVSFILTFGTIDILAHSK